MVYRHALRNAMVPVLTVVGLQFGALLAGAIVTETIFSWTRHRTADGPGHRKPRLFSGAGLHSGDRPDLFAVNFLTGLAVLGRESQDSAIRTMSTAAISLRAPSAITLLAATGVVLVTIFVIFALFRSLDRAARSRLHRSSRSVSAPSSAALVRHR